MPLHKQDDLHREVQRRVSEMWSRFNGKLSQGVALPRVTFSITENNQPILHIDNGNIYGDKTHRSIEEAKEQAVLMLKDWLLMQELVE